MRSHCVVAVLLQAVLLGSSAGAPSENNALEVTAQEQYTLEIGSAITAEEPAPRSTVCSSDGHICVGRSAYEGCPGTAAENFIFQCDQGQVCTTSGNTLCIPEPPACTSEGVFRFPGRCERFYLCVRTGNFVKQYVGTCEPGFEFSTRTGMCSVPEDAGCSIPEPPPITTPVTPPNNVTDPGPTPEPTPRPTEPFACTAIGLFADVNSCRHYFMCVRSLPSAGGGLHATRLTCPLILPHFNPATRLCWFFNETCARGMCGM